ncbi:unnamed protein product [Parnassius apollo]|uniref:(apollo) hypothetical protein n=1 Tax=Parnassius apollo TaxID=110799 RepID=A0A8S3WBT1_PARAO|nr:unnamed protein product [Parnassius apollo]
MSARKKLAEDVIQNLVDNLEDISDLSECDENDDPCWGDFVSSPADSYISLPAEQVLERRLEEMFGPEVNYEDVFPGTEVIEQQNVNLLEILESVITIFLGYLV